MAEKVNAKWFEKKFANGAHRHAGGGFARAASLQHVADIGEVVLERSGQIGMPRPRTAHGALLFGRSGLQGRHGFLPVLPVLVPDDERNRSSQALAEAHARHEVDLVGLDFHSSAPPMASLAPL